MIFIIFGDGFCVLGIGIEPTKAPTPCEQELNECLSIENLSS